MLKQTEIKTEMQKRQKKIGICGKMEFMITEYKIKTSEAQQFYKDETKSFLRALET